MQKHVNLVDLVKSFPTNILLQNLALIQKKTSPITFACLAKSGSAVRYRTFQLRPDVPAAGYPAVEPAAEVLERRVVQAFRCGDDQMAPDQIALVLCLSNGDSVPKRS